MREIDILAERVQTECAVPVSHEAVCARLRPILADFRVERDELIEQTARAIEQEYVAEGGVIVEWDGERGTLDDDTDPEIGY